MPRKTKIQIWKTESNTAIITIGKSTEIWIQTTDNPKPLILKSAIFKTPIPKDLLKAKLIKEN